jgi:hypothetical protein
VADGVFEAALNLENHVPVVTCDDPEQESVKEVLIGLLKHLLTMKVRS